MVLSLTIPETVGGYLYVSVFLIYVWALRGAETASEHMLPLVIKIFVCHSLQSQLHVVVGPSHYLVQN